MKRYVKIQYPGESEIKYCEILADSYAGNDELFKVASHLIEGVPFSLHKSKSAEYYWSKGMRCYEAIERMSSEDLYHNLYEVCDDEEMIRDFISDHESFGEYNYMASETEKLYNDFSEYAVEK